MTIVVVVSAGERTSFAMLLSKTEHFSCITFFDNYCCGLGRRANIVRDTSVKDRTRFLRIHLLITIVVVSAGERTSFAMLLSKTEHDSCIIFFDNYRCGLGRRANIVRDASVKDRTRFLHYIF